MDELKLNVFLVDTHFQFLTAISACAELYPDYKLFVNKIFVVDPLGRFGDLVNESVLNELSNSSLQVIPSRINHDVFMMLVALKPNQLIFSQEGNPVYRALAKSLKKNNKTTVSLYPDGSKAYMTFSKKHEFLSNLKNAFVDLKFLYSAGLSPFRYTYVNNFRYGEFDFVDNIYLPYCHLFGKTNKHLDKSFFQIPKFSQRLFHLLKINFNWNFTDKLISENSAVWIASPFKDQVFFEYELKLFDKFLSEYDILYIKPHPRDKGIYLDLAEENSRIRVIDTNVPAEFILYKLSNCLVASLWSTSMIYPLGINNKYQYYFDYFKPFNKILMQIDFTGFVHVKMINKL